MTKQEAIENSIKDIRKHLKENDYCVINITRKDKEIKNVISIFEGDFETITAQAGMSCEIESEAGDERN